MVEISRVFAKAQKKIFSDLIENMSVNSINQNISVLLTNWRDSKPVPQLIDSVTYDLYESNNPFRKHFDSDEISNKNLRIAANITTTAGAEVFSAFSNPFYIMHKFAKIPTYYQNAVNLYNSKK